jgi:hypothetical protein
VGGACSRNEGEEDPIYVTGRRAGRKETQKEDQDIDGWIHVKLDIVDIGWDGFALD